MLKIYICVCVCVYVCFSSLNMQKKHLNFHLQDSASHCWFNPNHLAVTFHTSLLCILYFLPGLIKSYNFICNDPLVSYLFIRCCRLSEKALMGFPQKKTSRNLSQHLELAMRFNGEAKVNVTVLSEKKIPLRATSDQIFYCCDVNWTLINDCRWLRWVNWAKPHLMNQKMKWLLLGLIDWTGWYTCCCIPPKG